MIAVLAAAAFPILFNDHHVDLRPEEVVAGRVLVALAQGDEIDLPLHQLLAEIGATVTYDPATRTATFARAGTSFALTAGVAQAAIDGEVRPLDVPPIVRNGTLLVPLRAIVEAMGAYVAYVPQRDAVVVRYAPTVALQAAAPPVVLAPEPTPLPARPVVPPGPPIPVDPPEPESYLEAVAAFDRGTSLGVRATSEFSFLDVPFVVEGTYAPAPERDEDVRLGVQLAPQKLYAEAVYDSRVGGVGFGVEKLPILANKVSYDGSLTYFPHMSGVLSYRAGLTYGAGHAFLEAGYQGARGGNVLEHGAYAALGVRL